MILDTDDLVTQHDIALMVSVRDSAVANWRKRYENFPEPVWREFYSWTAFAEWYRWYRSV